MSTQDRKDHKNVSKTSRPVAECSIRDHIFVIFELPTVKVAEVREDLLKTGAISHREREVAQAFLPAPRRAWTHRRGRAYPRMSASAQAARRALAYASRVYSVRCTRTLRWKTEYTRDAYATAAATSPSFGLLSKTPSIAIETEHLAP